MNTELYQNISWKDHNLFILEYDDVHSGKLFKIFHTNSEKIYAGFNTTDKYSLAFSMYREDAKMLLQIVNHNCSKTFDGWMSVKYMDKVIKFISTIQKNQVILEYQTNCVGIRPKNRFELLPTNGKYEADCIIRYNKTLYQNKIKSQSI